MVARTPTPLLLARILGTSKGAQILRESVEGDLGRLATMDPEELMQVRGLGAERADRLWAACELGRRLLTFRLGQVRTPLQSSSEAVRYLQAQIGYLDHEVFCVMYLNRALRLVKLEQVSQGGITGTVADPRIIFLKALSLRAVSLILGHNHPSGALHPSESDRELTEKIRRAAEYFDMTVHDHLIVSREGYYSFADEGIL
ncbi:MAG: DNA repair protein RadC [Bacteroidetes bacterium]|nr:DNA repair protein RadC [Bacteroidota bacterium]